MNYILKKQFKIYINETARRVYISAYLYMHSRLHEYKMCLLFRNKLKKSNVCTNKKVLLICNYLQRTSWRI